MVKITKPPQYLDQKEAQSQRRLNASIASIADFNRKSHKKMKMLPPISQSVDFNSKDLKVAKSH